MVTLPKRLALSPWGPMRSDEEMRKFTVGEPKIHDAPISLADYDPAWPHRFATEEARIRARHAAAILGTPLPQEVR